MMEPSAAEWPQPDFSRGLLAAVVQDADSGQVRMVGWMNEEAYRLSRESGLVTFWSRSRERIWRKGESSGNVLWIERVLADCDGDALLVFAHAAGPTCHTGSESCFGEAPSAPTATAAPSTAALAVLAQLERVIARRERDRPAGSYTVRLLEGGPQASGRKVVEEAAECAFAAAFEGPERLADEAADLVYHLLVLLRCGGVALEEVARHLADRQR